MMLQCQLWNVLGNYSWQKKKLSPNIFHINLFCVDEQHIFSLSIPDHSVIDHVSANIHII